MQSSRFVEAEAGVVGEAEVVVEINQISQEVPEQALSILVQSILIFLLEIGPGAPCTSATGKGHISARSQPHARGRTSSRQSLIINETVTSPATHLTLHF